MEPSLFYTGLVAEMYGPLKSLRSDPEPYARFVARCGEPALELGCGDGEPLLELRRRGLDVEGLDSSADMLERCRQLAAKESLSVVLHHQTMQEMELGRRFRSIFLAGPTFNLLPDDTAALSALRAIARHLDRDGTALIPLFIPSPSPPSQLGVPRTARGPDGVEWRFTAVSESRNDADRVQASVLRYERLSPDPAVVERSWILHWYSVSEFRQLVTAVGLITTVVLNGDGLPAREGDDAFAFQLTLAE
jgi:SAM-dependent methyltransferase